MTTSTRAKRKQPTPIDPRIKQRRVEVTRDAGRRRLRLVLGTLGVVALGAAGAGLTQTPALDIDRVVLVGATRTPLEQIRMVAGLEPGTPLTSVRAGEGARRLEALPWVASASIRRQWPGTVEVVLTERVPAAALARADGKWSIVDLEGRVLEVVATPPVALAHVHGAGRAARAGHHVAPSAVPGIRAAAAMPLSLRKLVGGINLTPQGIELGLTAGKGIVRLGDADRLEEKLRAAATVLSRVPSRTVSVLDVRVPRAPVLTRK